MTALIALLRATAPLAPTGTATPDHRRVFARFAGRLAAAAVRRGARR
ncbi:hypothetical protein [Prosthecomicrobium sp. N25]